MAPFASAAAEPRIPTWLLAAGGALAALAVRLIAGRRTPRD